MCRIKDLLEEQGERKKKKNSLFHVSFASIIYLASDEALGLIKLPSTAIMQLRCMWFFFIIIN